MEMHVPPLNRTLPKSQMIMEPDEAPDWLIRDRPLSDQVQNLMTKTFLMIHLDKMKILEQLDRLEETWEDREEMVAAQLQVKKKMQRALCLFIRFHSFYFYKA